MLITGAPTASAFCGFDGANLAPPNPHAIASSTDVFPCPFLPPITVIPFGDGASRKARTRFVFSISSAEILICSVMSVSSRYVVLSVDPLIAAKIPAVFQADSVCPSPHD